LAFLVFKPQKKKKERERKGKKRNQIPNWLYQFVERSNVFFAFSRFERIKKLQKKKKCVHVCIYIYINKYKCTLMLLELFAILLSCCKR